MEASTVEEALADLLVPQWVRSTAQEGHPMTPEEAREQIVRFLGGARTRIEVRAVPAGVLLRTVRR